MKCLSRESQDFCVRLQHPNPRAVQGLSYPKQGHFPKNCARPHFSNGSGRVPVLMDFDGEMALLHQQERVSDIALLNQNGIVFREKQLGFKLLQMGLKQMPRPEVDGFLLLCFGVHSGQATTPILIGQGLIP